MQAPATTTIMSLDVGERRIGIATADSLVRIPTPLETLERSPNVLKDIKELTNTHRVSMLVVGLPRGMEGQDTEQTRKTEDFVEALKQEVGMPVKLQDEALTSRQAEAELNSRGKPYAKGDIDALAAVYILEDFLQEQPEQTHE